MYHRYSQRITEVSIMAKTANINVRIEPETKAGAEKLFASFGITVTDAINIFCANLSWKAVCPLK